MVSTGGKMKTSTKRTYFLVGAILLILQLLMIVLTLVVATQFPSFVMEILQYNEVQLTPAELEEFYQLFFTMLAIFEGITAIITIVSCAMFFKFSKYSTEEFEKKKNLILIWSIIVLIMVNFLAGILGLIAAISSTSEQSKSQTTQEAEKPQVIKQESENNKEELQAKIQQLKNLKEKGLISPEEYEQLFSNLIK